MEPWIKCKALSFLQNASGAAIFEYVLLFGGVSITVVIILGAGSGMAGVLISGVCSEIDSVVGSLGTISC